MNFSGSDFFTLGNASGVGSGSFTYTIPANYTSSSSFARTSTIKVGNSAIAVSQPAGSCNQPGISPLAQNLDVTGGLNSLSVQLPGECTFYPISSQPWIQISSASQLTGSSTFYYFVSRNEYGPRSGTINIAGSIVQITQSGGSCTAMLGYSTSAFPNSGGTGTVPFTVSPSACMWTALSSAPWIRIGTAAGSGSTVTSFTVAPNPGSASRSGQIQIAGQLFTVIQNGGSLALPLSYDISTIAGTGGYPPYLIGGF